LKTKFIEATNDNQNWGKFLLISFDSEYEYKSAISEQSLLRQVGWNKKNIFVLDLQTGEGARFLPGGFAKADLDKHQIWVCPLYEPFLKWLYQQDLHDFENLPTLVNLPEAEFAIGGYRRKGNKND
jgi:hypothetical protein